MVPPVKPVNRKLQGVLVVFVGLLIYPMTAAVAEMFKRAIESVENQNFDAFLTYAVIAGIFAVGELVLGFLSTWMTFKYTQQLSMDAQTRH